MKFLAVLAIELSGNFVALDNDGGNFTRLDLRHEIAEIKFLGSWPRLVEHVEKQDHHQADNQPE
jgi:hypothetical protein